MLRVKDTNDGGSCLSLDMRKKQALLSELRSGKQNQGPGKEGKLYSFDTMFEPHATQV